MSDFLSRLAGRSMGRERVVQPVIPAMTAPNSSGASLAAHVYEETVEREHSASPPAPGIRSEPASDQSPPADLTASTTHQTRVGTVPQTATANSPIDLTLPPATQITNIQEHAVDLPAPEAPAWDRTLSAPASSGPSASPVERPAEPRDTASSAPPIVRVTIGRIEVRAEFPSPKVRPAAAQRPKPASLSLDDYLKQRVEGRR